MNHNTASQTLSKGTLPYLVGKEARLVGPIRVGGAGPAEGLHVGHGHPQDGQLVRLAGQRVAGGHHVRQLCDVGRHLVAPPPLDLAVVLPGGAGGQTWRGGGRDVRAGGQHGVEVKS